MVFQQPNLYLPPQGSPPGDFDPVAPRALRTWLAHLPTDDTITASSRLFSTLVRLNGYILEPADRFRALELIRETHAKLRSALRERYLNQQLPLDSDATRVASLVRRLDDAMATGYKMVIADLCGRSEAGMLFRRRTMPMVVYRALSHIGASISDAYEVYIPPSPPLLHDLHELFRFAEAHTLHQRPLKQEVAKDPPTPTICAAYKSVLLLALTNPFRLHHGDVPRLWNRLPTWAEQCRLQVPDAGGLPAHRVGVITGDARAPEYLNLDIGNSQSLAWYLDTQPLADALAAEARAMRESDTPEGGNSEARHNEAGAAFLQRLSRAWGKRPARRFARTPATARVEASLGLHQLHNLMELAGGSSPAAPSARATKPDWSPQIEVWRMKDRSPGGYRLSLEGSQTAQTSVGELIGVRGYPPKSLASGGWRVGVVRWLRNVPGTALEAGVEWLAPNAEAVKVQTLQHSGRPSSQLEALMLPEVKVFDRAPTLVTPAFVDGSTPSVVVDEQPDKALALTGEEENTGEHARFWYVDPQHGEPVATTAKAAKATDSGDG